MKRLFRRNGLSGVGWRNRFGMDGGVRQFLGIFNPAWNEMEWNCIELPIEVKFSVPDAS